MSVTDKQAVSEAVSISVVVAFIAISIAVITFFITQANIHGAEEKTTRLTTCVEAGGTWLERSEDCIQQHVKE